MQARRNSELVVCKYCNIEDYSEYLELVKQIPKFICSQEFLLAQISGFDGNLLKSDDQVCIVHEERFESIYNSFSRGGTVSKQHKSKYIKRGTSVEANCVYCTETCSVFRRISSFKDDFIKFLVNEGTQLITRSKGTGIHQGDALCTKCYLILRKKKIDPSYTPQKKSTVQEEREKSAKRKSSHSLSHPSKKMCSETTSSTSELYVDVSSPSDQPPKLQSATPSPSRGRSRSRSASRDSFRSPLQSPDQQCSRLQSTSPSPARGSRSRSASRDSFQSSITSPRAPSVAASPASSLSSDSSYQEYLHDTSFPSSSTQSTDYTVTSAEICAVCGKEEVKSKKFKNKKTEITKIQRDLLELFAENNTIHDGKFIHSPTCRDELRSEARKLQVCYLCKKQLKKAPKHGTSAIAIRFPIESLHLIENEEDRRTLESQTALVHQLCVDAYISEKTNKGKINIL